MGACLGIYLGDKLIKYAKLIRDEKSKKISLDSYGIKYVVGDKTDAIDEIVNQTGSIDASMCLNVIESHKLQTEILKQLSSTDRESVLNLEVGDFASVNGINEKTLVHREILMDSAVSNDSYTVDVTMTDKANINKYSEDAKYANVTGVYPTNYIIQSLIQSNSNYLIANIDEKTELISVVGGKIQKLVDIDISMKNILDKIAEQEGSYSKANDVCRGINVLSDESLSSELENIIEPVIQDLLNRIKSKIEESRIKYERIYLNGLINLFINIDVLFEQFFGINTEKLRPIFLKSEESTLNIAEVIETNEAIALAYSGLQDLNLDVNFMVAKNNKFSFGSLGGMFGGTDAKGPKIASSSGKQSKATIMPNINSDKLETALTFSSLTVGALLAGYVGFTAVYDMQTTKISDNLTENINKYQQKTASIKNDISYINQNTKKYTDINNYINDTYQKIVEGKIGKYTTYNVANFMQKVAKYIPTNVELKSISSDDNKSVTIVASSSSYAELGYLISQLKLQGILTNIKTGKVETTSTLITVTIGGDLP